MREFEADIVIVGAGASGQAAAIQASQMGASVVILEKSTTTGGAANMGNGMAAAESHIQSQQMDTLTVQEAFEDFMEYSHWKVNPRLVRRFWGLSADTIEWVEKMGVDFVGAYKYTPEAKATWHIFKVPGSDKPTERAGAICQKAMTECAKSLGVQYVFNVVADEILFDEEGYACGVHGKDENGEDVCAYGGAVLVGTGGFVNCPEMAKLVFGDDGTADGVGLGIPGLTGDGLRMCWAANGGKVDVFKRGDCFVVGITDIFKTIGETMHQFNLIVDINGKRFMNEEVLSNADYIYEIAAARPGRQFLMIINDEILDYYKQHGLEYVTVQHNVKRIDDWDKELGMYSRGEVLDNPLAFMHENDPRPKGFYVFDTIEELCSTLGVNQKNLEATLERYNSMAGMVDLDFYKSAKYMKPIRGGKYYVARYCPTGCGALGGVMTDENMNVITKEGKPIPGLYSMGTDANNMYSEIYNHRYPGCLMGFAINSGRIAGMEAVKFLQENA